MDLRNINLSMFLFTEINLYLVDGAHLSDWMSEVHEGTLFQADIFVI